MRDEWRKAYQMYRAGCTFEKISEELKVSDSTAKRWLSLAEEEIQSTERANREKAAAEDARKQQDICARCQWQKDGLHICVLPQCIARRKKNV